MVKIPFNRLFVTGREFTYMQEAVANNHLSGNGRFTKRCQAWLEEHLGCRKALLTHSCTAALEMAGLLAEVGPGDEVIMPSYTFVSTANAFVLRGGVPVFVDIRRDTLNLDESRVEGAVTPRTKAIVPVHYAGVACEMDALVQVAERRGLVIIEDAAQAVASRYRGRAVGRDGHIAAVSFHETKNVSSGEGGALLVNDERYVDRAEIIWEKGTNRSHFVRGQVDKYTWVDVGSSYLPGELSAAFLLAQLEEVGTITQRRMTIWGQYNDSLRELETRGVARRPIIPEHCTHNGHMFYLLVDNERVRSGVIAHLRKKGIQAVFHYVPLHASPAGRKYGRTQGDLPVTEEMSSRLVRLPFFTGMTGGEVQQVVEGVLEYFC